MFLLILLNRIYCGHIYTWDMELDYTNAGYATQFTIPFRLSNTLPSSGYLKVIFPFSLHYTDTNSIPDGVTASYQIANGEYQCGQGDSNSALIYINSAESNAYYVNFQTEVNNTHYYYLLLTTSSPNIQSSGVQEPVQLMSVMTISTIAMIIDYTPVGGLFSLDSEPSTDMQCLVSDTTTGMNDIYTITVSVQFKKNMDNGLRVQIILTNDFTFESACLIIDMSTKLYTCITTETIATFTINNKVKVNDWQYFNVTIRNPMKVTQQTSIEIRSMQQYANTITETTNSDLVLQVEQITLSTHKLYLGWGLEYSSRSAYYYPFPVMIFRGDQNGIFTPYNGIKWVFAITDELPEDILLQVEISTPMKFNSYLTSITHNLPSYPGITGSCSFVNSNTISQSKIVCINIGQLYTSTNYYISCRATFPYDQFNLPLEQKFGSLNIYTVTDEIVDSLSIIVESNPVSYIQTVNNPNWLNSNYDGTVVSSQVMDETFSDPKSGTLGIVPNLDDGDVELIFLNFNLAIRIDYIVSLSTPVVSGTSITYSAGLIIMCNNNILTTTTDIPELITSTSTTSQFFSYDYKSSNLASFLSITVGSTDVDGLLGMFCWNTNEVQTKYLQFAITNLQVKFHSSIYADEYLLDFYIGSFDRIQSTYPIFKQSMLTNAYTISSPTPSNIRFGIVNYFTSLSSGNTGDYFPTLIRLAGYFSNTDIENAQNKISLFFTNMQPIYEEDDQVYCKYTGSTQPTCTYFSAGLSGDGQSYMNYERIDIEFESLPTSSDDAFQLLIPVQTFAGNTKVSVFLAAVVDLDTQIQIRTVYRLTGGDNISSYQYSFPSTVNGLSTGFMRSGVTFASMPYQLEVSSTLQVGQNTTDLVFFIGHNDVSFINLNSKSNDNYNGGGFTLTSFAPFYTDDSTLVSTISVDGSKLSGCVSFEYSSKYVIYCPLDKASDSPLSTFTIKAGNLPFINGVSLPYPTVYTWSDMKNGLGAFRIDQDTTIPVKGIIKIISVSPTLELSQYQQQIAIKFSTTNPIPNLSTLRMEFDGTTILYFDAYNKGSRCQIVSITYGSFSHTCTISKTTSGSYVYINFYISNCDSCPWATDTFILYYWGLNSLYTSSDTITKQQFTLRLLSSNLNTIDVSKVVGSIQYDYTTVSYEMFLGNAVFQFYNMRAKGQIAIDFQATRSIWKQEYVLIDIGGFFADNQRNKNNIICQILESGTPSFQFSMIDYTLSKSTSISGIKIYPNDDITSTTIFTLKCYGIVIPYSANPDPMTATLLLQNTYVQIQNSNSVSLDSLYSATIFPTKNLKLISKSNNVCGSTTDIFINVTTTLLNVSLGTTIFIVFPTTYPFTVAANLTYCSINQQFVACNVDTENTVTLENFDISVSAGTKMQIRIYGALNSAIYNSLANEIFVGFTNNADTTVLTEYGVVYDQQGQDMTTSPPGSIVVMWLDSTQQYIRSNSTITYKISFPAGAITSSNIIQIDFPPAWDMIINYKLPTCSLYDYDNETNYASSCINFGNRITLTISQTDYIGSQYYYLWLTNVRNPDYTVCGINMWTITVLNTSYVFGRSHPINFNLPTFPYISNPNEITLKWINLTTQTTIKTVYLYTGIFNSIIGMASESNLFMRSFQIYCNNANFTANPTNINAPMGQAYTNFTLAGTSKAPQGLQLIEFAKTDDYDKHSELPFLRVFLSQKSCTLKTEMTLYQLTLGGYALPILFNLTNCQPSSNLRIEATSDNDKIYFKSKSAITFGLTQNIGAFLVASESTGITVGSSGVISFTVSGTYQSHYGTIDSISYRIIDINKKKPTINLYNVDRGTNYVIFTSNCNQYSVIYYYVSINGSQVLWSSEIQTNTYLWNSPEIDDYYQQSFGLVNSFVASKNYTATVSGLRPATTYNITAVCQNVETAYSSSATVLQTTKSNNGKSFYLDFIFDSAIDSDFSTSITCFLSQYFKVPARLIRNSINNWCSLYRRRILDTTTYSETNVRMYISLIDFELDDTVTSTLYANGINTTDMISNLYDQVAGLPNLAKLSDLTAMSTTVPIIESDVYINASTNEITLYNITTDQDGFIYAMVDYNNRTKPPSFYDLRVGNADRVPSNYTYYERQRYNQSVAINFTFSGLEHYTNYSIFYYASNDDPSEFQLRTYVYQINFRTAPKYVMYSCLQSLLLIMIILQQ